MCRKKLSFLELILYCSIWISGMLLIIQDLKSQNVAYIPLFVFLSSCVGVGIINKNFAFCPTIIFIIIGLIFFFWKHRTAFGLADYFVVFASSFLITNEQSPFFILLCGAFGILLSVITRNYKIPFIPAILLSTIVVTMLI